MPQLVITCHANGSVETLLKDKVIDTRIFGRRHIERLTEIRHFEMADLPDADQKFYVKWLKGPNAPDTLNDDSGNTRMFDTYEQAVAAEIAAVNAMRLKGVSFA